MVPAKRAFRVRREADLGRLQEISSAAEAPRHVPEAIEG